ncbi:hypothetical protein [Hymenobacter bucti]|uniref:Uncharacterized protein n=1 Tax=Hymenobacter bucti TaxID=1844114 RepID=A0ABW4QUY4_9BACT
MKIPVVTCSVAAKKALGYLFYEVILHLEPLSCYYQIANFSLS